MGPSAWNHGTWGSAEAQFAERLKWRGAIFMPDGLVRIAGVARSAALRPRNERVGVEKFSKMPRRKLRNREAYGKKFDSRLRSFFEVRGRRSAVGAPTSYARQGNGSHHSEDLSFGRGRPPGQFPGAYLWTLAWRRFRRSAYQKPLRLDVGGSFARPVVVRRPGDSGLGPYSAVRIAGVFQQVAKRLRSQHRTGNGQRNCRACAARAGSGRFYVQAVAADRSGN